MSSKQLEEFQWNFRKDVTYDNIKSHKNPGLLEKTTGGRIGP